MARVVQQRPDLQQADVPVQSFDPRDPAGVTLGQPPPVCFLGHRVRLVRRPVLMELEPQVLVAVAELQVGRDPLGQLLRRLKAVVPALGGRRGEPVRDLGADLRKDVVLGDQCAQPADDGPDLFGVHDEE
jgi:hypothetical protein